MSVAIGSGRAHDFLGSLSLPIVAPIEPWKAQTRKGSASATLGEHNLTSVILHDLSDNGKTKTSANLARGHIGLGKARTLRKIFREPTTIVCHHDH
jgi:hypothetical protein